MLGSVIMSLIKCISQVFSIVFQSSLEWNGDYFWFIPWIQKHIKWWEIVSKTGCVEWVPPPCVLLGFLHPESKLHWASTGFGVLHIKNSLLLKTCDSKFCGHLNSLYIGKVIWRCFQQYLFIAPPCQSGNS